VTSFDVEPGVVDGDPGGRGQRVDDHLVVVVEGLSVQLLRQVQPSENGFARPHRNTEETRHRRMVGRKTHRCGMGGKVIQPQCGLLLDDDTEHAVPGGQRTDQLPGRWIDAGVDEFAQLSVLVQHPEGAVTGPYELGCRIDDVAECRIELEAGRDPEHSLEHCVHPTAVRVDDRFHTDADLGQQLLQPDLGQRVREVPRPHRRERRRVVCLGHNSCSCEEWRRSRI
jgi:hypothetical protein